MEGRRGARELSVGDQLNHVTPVNTFNFRKNLLNLYFENENIREILDYIERN